jgi:uncharacterized protein with FMN-binding domain
MTTDPRNDERLARLQARANAHRDELAFGTPSSPPPGAGPTKRRHAARGSRGAALALSAVSTLGLAGWFHQASATTTSGSTDAVGTDSAAGTASTTASTTATTAASAGSNATSSTSSSTTAATTGSSTTLADGTYTGSSVSTRYGPVQVQITVSGGTITAVDVIDYPDGDSKSASINARAVPTLVQETLTSQSASVSSVSGATYTTNGYKTSLQSAIDAAKAAAS